MGKNYKRMTIHQDALERINTKIVKLKTLDINKSLFGAESHNYELQATLSDATEKSHQITLPPAYRVDWKCLKKRVFKTISQTVS